MALDWIKRATESDHLESRLRLQTIVRLRWVAVLGQLASVCLVALVLGFKMPVGTSLSMIALSAWLNVFLAIRYPARHRLNVNFAAGLLMYDIIQLAVLLYLTGGIENPFMMLMVAPVTVSAATLPPRTTMLLGLLSLVASGILVFHHQPLPWTESEPFVGLPRLYEFGIYASVAASTIFLAFYAWRLTKEAREMSAALAATDLVLAREQKLHALDGLAAAAAHELGTPLSTIVLVTKELEREFSKDQRNAEDITLLRTQAERCREILQKLTRRPSEQDPLHATISILSLVDEASGPHRFRNVDVHVTGGPTRDTHGVAAAEPIGQRRPGVIYGVGNLVENAVDFAKSQVEVTAEWNVREVTLTVMDDGPGFPPDVLDTLGEPYVTTRRAGMPKKSNGESSGLGLGFFIAKTLLERSGAVIVLENRLSPETGATVRIIWPRAQFEIGAAVIADAYPAKPRATG